MPKTYKSLLRLLIEIAEHGNDYKGYLSHEDELEIGSCIADIQNWLGENTELLERLKLEYDSSIH